ncbi:hypothetical protein [Pseudomonas abietaniphila]|uniref:hypothetical protein n=1 Tax=Pseudomonas abietaniphila TaxID=89065 RepID=UPI000B04281F|nr:hypothetical protein [Pseudomonas abietaniphila]
MEMLKRWVEATSASVANQHQRPLPKSSSKRFPSYSFVFLPAGKHIENIPYHVLFLLLEFWIASLPPRWQSLASD